MPTLSTGQRKKARQLHNTFQLINNFAFVLVNGSVVTLYALKANAPVSFLGLIASLNFMSFICVPLGNILSRHFSIIKIYGWAWMLRYLSILPMLGVPFSIIANRQDVAIGLMLIASLGFNLFRGIGMVGNNPVIATMTTEKERSRYLAMVFIITFLGYIIGSFFLVFVLHIMADSIWAYFMLFLAGTIAGVWSSFFVFSFPEFAKNDDKHNIIQTVVQAMRRPSFRTFILSHFGVSLTLAMVRPFAIVYTKEVYHQADSMSILLTTVGFLGALFMGLFSRLTVNVVGTKALHIFYIVLSLLSLIPVILSPQMTGLTLIIFLIVFHFLSNLGMYGLEANAQSYLFGVIRTTEIADVFSFFYIIYGLGGGIGSLLGGGILNFCERIGMDITESYRVFFLIAFSFLVFLLYVIARLQNTGKHSVFQSLGYIFSVKDMRALSLANKLEETTSPKRQLQILHEMSYSHSDVSEDFLLEALGSPREQIRHQALLAIESMPSLKDRKLIMALIKELHYSPYTTAYIAARILGKMKITRSIAEMRTAMNSPDYRLEAEAIFALSEMKDSKSVEMMIEKIAPSTNPYVLVRLFAALEKILPEGQIRYFFRPLLWNKVPKDIAREALLSATIRLGIFEWFYPFYCTFLKSAEEGYQALLEHYQIFSKKISMQIPLAMLSNELRYKDYIDACENFWDKLLPTQKIDQISLRKTKNNPLIIRHDSFRFMLTAYLVYLARPQRT
ncbi:MAG: MFS transporter [Spirochaetia bacterium]